MLPAAVLTRPHTRPPPWLCSSCARLERLWLQDNAIDFIPRNALAKNRFLKELRLGKNRIETVTNLACQALTDLDISSTGTKRIKVGFVVLPIRCRCLGGG